MRQSGRQQGRLPVSGTGQSGENRLGSLLDELQFLKVIHGPTYILYQAFQQIGSVSFFRVEMDHYALAMPFTKCPRGSFSSVFFPAVCQ